MASEDESREGGDADVLRCAFCDEAILDDDRDVKLARNRSFHGPCVVRSVLGSVGHLRGTCSCYGGSEGDPPGMTKRQAAQAVCELLGLDGQVLGRRDAPRQLQKHDQDGTSEPDRGFGLEQFDQAHQERQADGLEKLYRTKSSENDGPPREGQHDE